jgi:hypothetical protein
MTLAGELSVRVHAPAGVVTAVDIASTRPQLAQTLLAGRPLAEALATVPTIFAVCGRAQAVAAQLAAAAAGAIPAPDVALRERQIEAEIAQEYLLQLLLRWPRAAGGVPDAAAVARLRASLVAGDTAALRTVVERDVLGMTCEAWLDSHVPAFEIWIARGATLAATHLADVQRDGARHGAGGIALLPLVATEPAFAQEIAQAVASDAEFPRAPIRHGAPAETGALARLQQQPLVAALCAAYGHSTLARLVARVTELARMAAGRAAPAPLSGSVRTGPAAGLGWVETARGLLVHWLELAPGAAVPAAQRWRIVAPTEWNFHPRGALAAGLLGAHVAGREELRRRADWLIDALDPCVSYRLEVVDA